MSDGGKEDTHRAKEDVGNGKETRLFHIHVCVHCGSLYRREEYEGRPLTSGVFFCTRCGLEGPLNVEIREVTDTDM